LTVLTSFPTRRSSDLGRQKSRVLGIRRLTRSRPEGWKPAGLAGQSLAGHWWRVLDSNQRRQKPAGLQPAPIGHSGNPPRELVSRSEEHTSELQSPDHL